MRTAIVILNWNTRAYLARFLPPLLDSLRGRDAGVVVADSASTDGSRELLAERFPEVRTILLERNFGFTGGYNHAFGQLLGEPGGPEVLVLLNSDIEVSDGWLDPLVEWMDTHPGCAACGPKLHALVRDGEDFRRTDRFEYAGAAGGCIDRFGFPFCRGRVLSRTEEDYGQYDIPAEYYSTTFHELTHSTIPASRCDRVRENANAFFGNADYSREELVAEIGSAMLCNRTGIDVDKAFRNSVAYIHCWLKSLKDDPKMIVWAAGRAEKAAKFILNEF